MSMEIKERLQQNAKILRYICRQKAFQQNRMSKQSLDYLRFYDIYVKNQILESINGPIPTPLPPVSPTTISYYRRAEPIQPIFKTKSNESTELDPHMTYESLWILAGLDEKLYPNYQNLVRDFEKDLEKYLNCQSNDIKEMAIIAAGNKIIGRQKEIISIVEADLNQMWVLINHIYERKISFRCLFPYIKQNNEIVYRTIYEMSNNKDDESIQMIIDDQKILQQIVDSLSHPSHEIRKYAIRIIGNILAEKEQYVSTLQNYKLLQSLFDLLMSEDVQIRKDTCWVLSNYAFQRNPSTQVLRNKKIMAKLVQLLHSEQNLEIKRELAHIFSHLTAFAEKVQIFQLLAQQNILQTCYYYICLDDSELTTVTLFLIQKIIELGQSFSSEEGNLFCNLINSSALLKGEIRKKQYSQNVEISSISLDIWNDLEGDY